MASVGSVGYSVEKCPKEYHPYSSNLTDGERSLAKDQLGEDDAVRVQALQQMREMIASHPHIRRCRTDPAFLLRFLRARKYNLAEAIETLERYLSMRQVFRIWFENLDPEDKYMKQLLATEGALPLGVAHFTLFKLSDIRNFMECLKHALPVRVQEVHLIGLPRIGAAIGDLILTFASAEMKRRINFHANLSDALKLLDVDLLPVEYGGSQSAADVTERLRDRLAASREILLQLDELEIDGSPYAGFWNQGKDEDVEFGMEID
nr:uncharacterized protein LOC109399208 isoform X2 [Aedes albopictus]